MPPPDPAALPFPQVAAFVRQLTHDFRNVLNVIDLEASLLAELTAEPEAAVEIRKVRETIVANGKMLHLLSTRFADILLNQIPVPLAMLVEDQRARLTKLFPDEFAAVEWTGPAVEGVISADYELVSTAIAELFRNAFQLRVGEKRIAVETSVAAGEFRFRIIEEKPAPATDPASWGEALVSTRRGGYGLGIFHARRIVTAHGGRIEHHYDPAAAALHSDVILPLADET